MNIQEEFLTYKIFGEYKNIKFYFENFGIYALLDLEINNKCYIENTTIKAYRVNKKSKTTIFSYNLDEDKIANIEACIKLYIDTLLNDLQKVS
ncbi:hypothetical protein [Campylobacter sp. RM12651]|uniref:hypothetical protein n=1 Tax=Campylobacter sp. RM12651 TaxID=1660079 RepID=UPI001EFBE15C|nr:hypothetical protein [Campylobacter sp. RM12651]ULO03817.1 hypothetical protein AVBRAN_1363 [Campylobacter sp. RM12651]